MMYCRAGAIDSWFRAVLTSGLGLALCAMVPVVMASEQVLTLGAYAYLPTAEMERRFQPLASYLSEQVPNVRVELEVHSLESLDQAVQDYHVDLVLTNPRHYISLRASNSLTGVMVTLIKRGVDGTPTRSLGGVIFSRAERDDLASLSDLRGQRIAIPSRLNTGAYLAPVYELDRAGVPLPSELHRVGSHTAVVREVLSGAVDVGFIRTEILEELAASGQLDLNEIKVINRQALGDYPFISSTRLYPEWPLIALPGVDDRTMRLIMAALLALDPDGPVAVQAQIAGFAPPADYLPMEQMLRERFISVPVTEHGKVVMLTGVGNKVQDYDATDVETLQLISNETWNLVQRRRNQRRLERSASVFLHAREGILVAALDGTIVDVNDAFVRLTGYERDELIGQTPRLFKSGRHGANYYAELWHSLVLKGYWRGQIWNRCKDGEQRAQSVTISAVRKAGQEATEFVALYSDITEQLDYQRQLEHAAHFDALTELPNRVLLADRMRQALGRTKRRGLTLAVLYLDLDGFKEVNDRHGHDQGDRLLREVAQRMRGCLREVDTLARLGGDEFVAVLTDLQTEHAVVAQVKRLLAAVSQPIQLEKAVVQLAVSIGVTFYPQRSEVDEDLLLRQADQAMYQAKLAGRNRYLLFDVDQELDQRGRLQSRDRLQWALERGELLFYYQPKVNMRTGNVIGAEALLRWQHPERGLLAPGSFLLQAADERLMIEIGALAVTRALEHLDDWGRDGRMLGLSVNIHAHHLQQAGFVDWLRDVLALHPGFAPGRLTLEVLETSALEDLGLIKRVIEDCSRLGVELSLDDFGTGYSSLTYLRNLPAAEIKVDTSFVRGCLCNPDDLAILEGVLGLATAFQRRVVAEGVETLEHGKLLLALGCELAQGYAIARPMPADEFERWLGGWQVPEVWRQTQTIDREDVAVLFSVIEHCAWVEQWGRFASDGGDAPDTSAAVCRFGLWLRGEAKARYGQRPSFAEIEPLHARIHQVAKALVESAQGEDSPSTGAILDELHSLRDCLYELTLRLLQEKAADHLAHPDAALPWDDVKTAAVAQLKVRAER